MFHYSMAQNIVNRNDISLYNTQKNEIGNIRHGLDLSIKYGFNFGLTLSNIQNKMNFDPNFSVGKGYSFGTLINLHFGQRTINSLPGTGFWGIQSEIKYSNQNINSDGGKITLSSIQIPIMIKVYPTPKFSIECGPELSYILSMSPKTIVGDGVQVNLGECKGLYPNICLGFGYETNNRLSFGARCSMGLKDFGDNIKWREGINSMFVIGCLF